MRTRVSRQALKKHMVVAQSPVPRGRLVEELSCRGISKNEILHVAQSKHHDINPARRFGLTTVWINRRHGKKGSGATLATSAEPDLTVTSLAELVSLHKARNGDFL